ncbi:hypothetical protein J2X05_004197 [Cellvibrio fibrivorans]|uniref:Uncharacterized protein n=1 Tax=Cellvibrio fibrivorans TaxID=126350 RepID=A0ABU1V3Y5_9GAMM|nr:hypothetical protein [Cellvibrio fibrivorans]
MLLYVRSKTQAYLYIIRTFHIGKRGVFSLKAVALITQY